MEVKFDFQCSTFLNTWQPVIGYTTKQINNDVSLNDNELEDIKNTSIPSGSQWKSYSGYYSLRFFKVLINPKSLFVFSVSEFIQNPETSRYYPETFIAVIDERQMNLISKRGAKWLLDKIYSKQLSDSVFSIELPQLSGSFYSFELDTKYDNFKKYRYIFEFIFIQTCLNNWIKQKKITSFSTLCTPQDRLKSFDLIGIIPFDRSQLWTKVNKYSKIIYHAKPNRIQVRKISKIRVFRRRVSNALSSDFLSHPAFLLIIIFSFFLLTGGILIYKFILNKDYLLLQCSDGNSLKVEFSHSSARLQLLLNKMVELPESEFDNSNISVYFVNGELSFWKEDRASYFKRSYFEKNNLVEYWNCLPKN